MTTFVDTSAFYAVLDRSDDHHHAAAAEWVKLLERADQLVTSNYIVVETVALLQNRIGIDAVRAFVADILPVVRTEWVDDFVHHVGQHALLVSGQRRLSLVDCVSFELMRSRAIEASFCFDADFADQGFLVIPESKIR